MTDVASGAPPSPRPRLHVEAAMGNEVMVILWGDPLFTDKNAFTSIGHSLIWEVPLLLVIPKPKLGDVPCKLLRAATRYVLVEEDWPQNQVHQAISEAVQLIRESRQVGESDGNTQVTR